MRLPADRATLERFDTLAALPAGCACAFSGRAGFFSSFVWWRTVVAAGLGQDSMPCFALFAPEGRPLVLFALVRTLDGRGLEAMTNPYTCLYQPAVAEGTPPGLVFAAGRALGRFARRWPSLRLDALDADWPDLAPLLAGARRAGLLPLRFLHFGNWHEPVAGVSWAAYTAARPGALRETIRRRLRAAERDARITWQVIARTDEIEAGIAAYEDVYTRSWKEPEPYPLFNATLMREAAAAGALRLGVLRVEGRPVAVQIWIVWQGTAAVLKLAHDEAYKAISPGTVLTAQMIRRLLDEEAVTELDFGRGDDPYKQSWAQQRRQRIGVILVNPLHPRGLALLVRHTLGQLRRKLQRS